MPERARLSVIREDGWTLIDAKYAGCLNFATRAEAREAQAFCRAYLKRHGDLNLFSYPYDLQEPPSFPEGDDPRFEEDCRVSGGVRRPVRSAFADEVERWWQTHPDAHARWLAVHPEEADA